MSAPISTNQEIRAAAGLAITRLIQKHGTNILPWSVIAEGFLFKGTKVLFATKAKGIFKSALLTDGAALSIKEVRPSRAGRSAPYNDRDLEDGTVIYNLQRGDPLSKANTWLTEACRQQHPLIFFRGVSDALYEVIYPAFILNIDPSKMESLVSFGESNLGIDDISIAAEDMPKVEEPLTKGYSATIGKSRHHQKAFRNRVLLAYGVRCAITGLPLPQLLEAAHIVPDSRDGEASVQNGIAMSCLHHTAYEQNLLGIDPDGFIHLSESVRATKDGPLFEHGILRFDGQRIRFPSFDGHHPNRDFLASRFELFTKSN
jgi:Predicted restriction endonuclease